MFSIGTSMKSIKATLAAFLLLPAATFAATKVTFVGDASYKPYVYMDFGDPSGKYVEIIEKAFTLMPDYEVEWNLMKWEDALKQIETGEAFAIVPPYLRPNVRPYIDPYSEPVLEEQIVLLCTKSSVKENMENFPQDFSGLVFTNDSRNQSPGNEFFDMVEDGAITLYETPATKVNVESLIEGNANCYVNNNLTIEAVLSSLGKTTNDFYTKTLKTEKGYVGFAKNSDKFPFKEDFIKKFNEALKKVTNND